MIHQVREQDRKNTPLLFYLVLLLFPVIVVVFAYGGYTIYRAKNLYSYIKSNQRGWSGRVFKPDSELGIAAIPNAQGIHLFPIGPDIPMRFDGEGLRIPVSGYNPSLDLRPLVLALGCSFTYGDAVPAEDVYPYLVGKYLGGTAKNAGCCSCGLAQMLILARKLIPEFKPDYVLVQFSPWLLDRALNPFAPAYFGKIPVPYFYGKEEIKLYPPVFSAKMVDLPIDEYRGSPGCVIDFVSFLWNVGLPQFVYDDYQMTCYFFKRILGIIPEPALNRNKVVRYVYGEIAKVAEENGARMIIVILGRNQQSVEVPYDLLPPHAIIVNAHKALLARLPTLDRKTYKKHYAHWRGNPPRVVDNHPNEKAHRIIAEAIVSRIRDNIN